MRLWRMENPAEAHFAQIKNRAARREIAFTITLEEYKAFIAGTEYTNKRGRKAWNLHIDRKAALKGYETGNLQILLAAANCAKGATTDKERRKAFVEAKIKAYQTIQEPEESGDFEFEPSENCPF